MTMSNKTKFYIYESLLAVFCVVFLIVFGIAVHKMNQDADKDKMERKKIEVAEIIAETKFCKSKPLCCIEFCNGTRFFGRDECINVCRRN